MTITLNSDTGALLYTYARAAAQSTDDLRVFFDALIEQLGAGFHPDTAAAEYYDRFNVRVFDDELSKVIDGAMGEVMLNWHDRLLPNPYKIALDAVRTTWIRERDDRDRRC